MTDQIWEGIWIGVGGGAGASAVILFAQYIKYKYLEWHDTKKIYCWLKSNIKSEDNTASDEHKSTRAIASWNNLPEDRVRYLCSIDQRIYLSTGEKEDIWGLTSKRKKSSKSPCQNP